MDSSDATVEFTTNSSFSSAQIQTTNQVPSSSTEDIPTDAPTSVPAFSFDGASTNIGIDQLVKDYLRAKGYESAATAMEHDMQVNNEGKSTIDMLVGTTSARPTGYQQNKDTSERVDGLNLVEAVYIKALHESDFSIYLLELDSFSSWVFSSFDTVKNYLIAALFAMFCHCYVAMIRNGAVEAAQRLFARYREFFHRAFAAELHRLSLLQAPDQLNDVDFISNNSFIKSLLKSKFTVQMTPLALQLVSQKLRQDNLVMLATIINQKVTFEKLEPVDASVPESDSQESWSLISLPGYNPEPIAERETARMILGVVGMGDIAKYWKERSALFAEVEFPDIAHDSLLQTWGEKLVRPRSLLRKLARMDGSIPNAFDERALDQLVQRGGEAYTKLLPSHSGSGNYESVSSSSAAAATSSISDDTYVPGKYGDTLNPSIICATISNAYDQLTSMDITASVNQIATGHHDNVVRVWRLDQSPEEQRKLPWFGRNLPAPYQWEMNQVLPIPIAGDSNADDHSASGGKTVGSSGSSMSHANKPTAYPCLEFLGHNMPVYSVAQSACERFVFSASADETIRVWDTSVVQCVGNYHCFSTPWHVRVSPIDAYYFAAGHADRSVSVYAMDREAPVRLMTGHTSDVNVLAWHGNGVLLASGSDDRSSRLWDMRSAQCVRIFHHCNAPITALQVSSLGTLVAAGTEQGKIYVWDIRSSRQLAILQGHTEEVTSLSFSKDRNQALCSGALDCSVRIWDLRLALETTYNPAPTGQTTLHHRSASYLASSGIVPSHLPSAQTHDYSVSVLKARNAYFTKACPIFQVGYTDKGMVFCGGMYSASAASAIREKNVAENSASVAEQTLIKSFGMSSVAPTKTVTSTGMHHLL